MEKEDQERSRGFGFVEFNTLEEATAAIDGLNETPLGHRHIMVQHAGKPASGKPPQRRGTTSNKKYLLMILAAYLNKNISDLIVIAQFRTMLSILLSFKVENIPAQWLESKCWHYLLSMFLQFFVEKLDFH